ncbi:hypothetical protein IHE45_17G120400 [Dioscorea alata]|uniref:Uncharacterized protein n=1 Tax=Dioscorea alata TaxID=55571 RepID=A0ACB7UEZ8_DIOAL|nr:hypothetical protein IHE45_17G120400 [Dioscorea alata]
MWSTPVSSRCFANDAYIILALLESLGSRSI